MGEYAFFILLGIVQGLTEFLPVSSSGHLVFLQTVAGLNPPGVFTEIVLHIATLIAVLIHYRRDVFSLLSGRAGSGLRSPKFYMLLVILATAITAGLVFPFRDVIENLTHGRTALIALVFTFSFTALLMFITDFLLSRPRARAGEITSLGWMATAFIAVVQSIAALPGVSRSGSTIAAGVAAGLKREEAARFSFMLFIPITVLAALWESLGLIKGETAVPVGLWGPLILGFLAALLSGLFAIRLLLVILQRARLSWFGIYLALLAFTSLVLALA